MSQERNQERELAIQERESALQTWREKFESPEARRGRCLSDILLRASIGGAIISCVLPLYSLMKGVEAMIKHTGQAPERFLFTAVGLTIASTIGILGPMVSQRIGQPTKGELTALQRYIQLVKQQLPDELPDNGSIGSGDVSPTIIPPCNSPGTLALRELVTTH